MSLTRSSSHFSESKAEATEGLSCKVRGTQGLSDPSLPAPLEWDTGHILARHSLPGRQQLWPLPTPPLRPKLPRLKPGPDTSWEAWPGCWRARSPVRPGRALQQALSPSRAQVGSGPYRPQMRRKAPLLVRRAAGLIQKCSTPHLGGPGESCTPKRQMRNSSPKSKNPPSYQ